MKVSKLLQTERGLAKMVKSLGAILFAAFLLIPATVRADSTGPEYQINGTLTMTGDGAACGGSACVENISYSFDLAYSLVPVDEAYFSYPASVSEIYLAQIVGPVLVASSGPLDYLGESGGALSTDRSYYLPLWDSTGTYSDELDLGIGDIETDPALGTPLPYALGATFYACTSAACATDFDNGTSDYGYPDILSGPAQFTATLISTPEPSMFSFLFIGIIALCWLRLRGVKRFTVRNS